jgi:hypothetical protein
MKEYKIDLSGYDGKVREVVNEEIQCHAFELGYPGWEPSKSQTNYVNKPYLFIRIDGFGWCDESQQEYFENIKMRKISAADFLALTPEDVKDAPEFKPFDRVLVRDGDGDEWNIDFFEGMNKDEDEMYRYRCLNTCWRHCIPYEGNEHLLGTTENVK